MEGPWTEKFFPNDFEQFVGNVEIVDFARQWAKGWSAGKKQQPLLLFGPPGTGKTCIAILIAKAFDWQLFELNASDFRTKDVIDRVAGAASQAASFSGKPRLVLLDEVDGLHGNADRGGSAAISKILREARNPVILTANEIYGNQRMLPLRTGCKLLQFKKINYLSIAKRLRELLTSEGIEFDPEAVKLLARNCAGDFRSTLIDLQALSPSGKIDLEGVNSLGYRERQKDVFKTVEAIFKGESVADIRKARWQSEVSNEMLLRWVEENIPRHFTKGDDLASAFSNLSRADVFNGRIRNRQHYGFLRYSSELMTSGVALSRENDYHGWMHYQFPSLLRLLSSNKAERNLKKQISKKMSPKLHSSLRQVMSSHLPFLKMVFKDKEKAAMLSAWFDLDEKEIAFMMGSKPTTKKVQKIFEEAQALKQEEMLSKRKSFIGIEDNSLNSFSEEPKEEPAEEESAHKQTKLF
ncbi:MAG: replication factor C large subunit [archaeon]|nr:replication factor C large subunit [archaeon]